METPWETYGLEEGEWNALTEEERAAYLLVGTEENMSDVDTFEDEEPTEEAVAGEETHE